jgi:hypothetical protein
MRIAYISDVVPLPTHAGELVLHNHFARMPDSEILLVTPPHGDKSADTVNGRRETAVLPRLLGPLVRRPTRLIFQALAASYLDWRYRKSVGQFRPDVILTVWHSCFFFGAHRISRKLNVPLALICHDDHENCVLPPFPLFAPMARGWLSKIYRDASARFCVCPSMERIFARRYGARGTVLYPLATQATQESRESDTTRKLPRSIRLGYAGTIGASNFAALDAILKYLDSNHGSFYFASPTYQTGRDRVIHHSCVTDLGQLTPAQVCEFFPAHVDAMLVMQSFDPAESTCIQTAFPSKLVQYMQFCLPVLIIGPSTASACQWAEAHPEAVIVVHTQREEDISQALDTLSDSNRRQQMAEKVREIRVGEFAAEEIQRVFVETLEHCRSDGREPTNQREAIVP